MWVDPVGVKALEVGVVLMVSKTLWDLEIKRVARLAGHEKQLVHGTVKRMLAASQAPWRQALSGLFPMGQNRWPSIMN
jgi:hypothetical protein